MTRAPVLGSKNWAPRSTQVAALGRRREEVSRDTPVLTSAKESTAQPADGIGASAGSNGAAGSSAGSLAMAALALAQGDGIGASAGSDAEVSVLLPAHALTR